MEGLTSLKNEGIAQYSDSPFILFLWHISSLNKNHMLNEIFFLKKPFRQLIVEELVGNTNFTRKKGKIFLNMRKTNQRRTPVCSKWS